VTAWVYFVLPLCEGNINLPQPSPDTIQRNNCPTIEVKELINQW